MAQVLIRQAGPYEITTDSEHGDVYCNDERVTLQSAPKGSGLAMVVDTGRIGANGKRDLVGLTAEQYAIYTANLDVIRARREAAAAAGRAQDRAEHAEYFAEREALAAKAAAYNRSHNEGHEGPNPYRQQLDELDRRNGRATDAELRSAWRA